MTIAEARRAIKERDGELHAFLEVFGRDDHGDGALAGLPIAVKDNILIKGKVASAGSKILENYRATYDATVIGKLKGAGALLIGRTNMDEFAMGSSTENSAYGPTRNPHDLSRVPGGSSGGSAAAVAAGMCWAALGSDTGGSVRQPASFCGVVGFKPTYGAVSRYGLIAMGSSLDQIGVLAKTVGDARKVFGVIRGADPMDSTSIEFQSPKHKIQNLNVGLLKYDRFGVDADVESVMGKAVERLKGLGHTVTEVELPALDYALPCYYVIMPAEASTNLARFDGVRYGLHKEGERLLGDYKKTRHAGFGAEPKRRIILGTYVLSAGYYDAYYGRAQAARRKIMEEVAHAFESINVLMTPTAPTPAFKLGEKAENPLEMYLADIFTVSANVVGAPAISVPGGRSESGLPIGVQFMGPRFGDDLVLDLAEQFDHAS